MATLHAADLAGMDFPTKDALRQAVDMGTLRYLYRVGPSGLQGAVAVTDVTATDVIIGPTYYARPQWVAHLCSGQIV